MFKKAPSVLVVEDDPVIALDIEDTLLRLGCRVMAASELEGAMQLARAERLDLALLDFDLGDGADTVPVAETLSRRQVPFVFVSGAESAAIRQALPKARIVAKPISEGELYTLVQRLR